MSKDPIFIIFLYSAAVVLAALLWRQPYTLLLAYLILGAIMLGLWHTKKDFIYFFSPLVFGPLGEMVASYYGAWTYALPIFIIPVWLPVLWGIAGLSLMRLAKALTEE